MRTGRRQWCWGWVLGVGALISLPVAAQGPAAITPVPPESTAPGAFGGPTTPDTPAASGRHPLPQPEEMLQTALPADHPWRLKPETGPWFILVKSYSRPARPSNDDPGPTALELAEALAREIREKHRVQAWLFEYISEERKQQMEAIAAARERARLYAQQVDKLRREALLNGMEFLEPERKVRLPIIQYKDQIGVFIGPFQSEEDASKALALVKKWPAPQTQVRGTSLMDWGSLVRPGPDGKPLLEHGYLNPYVTAIVAPNPTVRRTPAASPSGLDPFIVQLNEGRPYNLLKATKAWTLAVKSFSAPVQLILPGNENVVRKPSSSASSADVLRAAAEQAESLARTLRELKYPDGRPMGLEAFVLHTRTASIVTVGQFDSPNDPELLRVQRILNSLKVTEDSQGLRPALHTPSLFDNMIPIPIPKATPPRYPSQTVSGTSSTPSSSAGR
ncbi:MAG: hypothetical protein NZ703_09130 [Gemmataceae bacterium]|nr:hypothetical protein [Gemmataceae bacterium]